MERKNTILLTVIAVATLLVAVVGATFAYFTATVNTTNQANNTTTVKTKTLVSAKMDMGSKVEATDILPGYKALKTVTIKGDGAAGDQAVNTVITLTPSVADFGTHVKYTLYKVATASAATNGVTCTASDPQTSTGNYYDAMTCDTSKAGAAVKSGTFSGTTPVTLDVVVEYNTDDTYYLVVEYENASGEQNAEQGKTFTVAIDFAAKA